MLTPILFLLFFSLSNGDKTACTIKPTDEKEDLTRPQPLILTKSYKILYPNENGILTFSKGQTVNLACQNEQIIVASCSKDKQFEVNQKTYEFKSFTCKKKSEFEVKIINQDKCLNNKFSKYEIGYSINNNFIPIYEICRNDKLEETYYAMSKMSKNIGGRQQKDSRPTWKKGKNLFSRNIDLFYIEKKYSKLMEKLLDSEKLTADYLKKAKLQRGHLAPKCDFVYDIEQDASFTYANTAPQWSSFNTGNWLQIEKAVRKFVEDNDLMVTIYTGVYGQMSLLNKQGKEQLLSLDFDKKTSYIRVPKFFWKIVYDPLNHLALTIVGVNDPFRNRISKDMYLCKDVSKDPVYSWLINGWNTREMTSSGLSYICDYKDLKKIADTVPELKVTGVLTVNPYIAPQKKQKTNLC